MSAASGDADAPLRRWRRAGGFVLAAPGGLRFLAEPERDGAWRLRTSGGRHLGRCDSLDECEARVRDALRSKA